MRLPRRLRSGETVELVDHLGELRSRVVLSLIVLAATSTVAFVFHGHLVAWLNAPLPEGQQPITLSPAEPFTTSLKLSLVAGFALALPFVLWQVWSFLAPAVEERLQRTIAILVSVATGLFVGGLVFGYTVALPAAIGFLTTYDDHLYDIEVRASNYYSFSLMVLTAVGLVFELPVFIVALVRLGVTSSARLRRNRRIGYVAVAAVAVALPGVDPVTTALQMVPLMALFEASIWISVALERRWQPVAARTSPA